MSKIYYCTLCHNNPVDSENGYDTCEECAPRGKRNSNLELTYDEWRRQRMIQLWRGHADEDHE